VIHINAYADRDDRPHVLTADCWCAPQVLRLGRAGCRSVVNHDGQPRPFVVDAPSMRWLEPFTSAPVPVLRLDGRRTGANTRPTGQRVE
jgi:hypothetical protein